LYSPLKTVDMLKGFVEGTGDLLTCAVPEGGCEKGNKLGEICEGRSLFRNSEIPVRS
jgi:hypothetical protein